MQVKSETRFIFICQSKSCIKNGSEVVGKEIKKAVKEQHFAKKIKIVKTNCMDACKNGPSVVCKGARYQKVSKVDIADIVRATK